MDPVRAVAVLIVHAVDHDHGVKPADNRVAGVNDPVSRGDLIVVEIPAYGDHAALVRRTRFKGHIDIADVHAFRAVLVPEIHEARVTMYRDRGAGIVAIRLQIGIISAAFIEDPPAVPVAIPPGIVPIDRRCGSDRCIDCRSFRRGRLIDRRDSRAFFIKYQIHTGIHNVLQRKAVFIEPAFEVVIAAEIDLNLAVFIQFVPARLGLIINDHAALVSGEQLNGKAARPHILDLDTIPRIGAVGGNVHSAGRVIRPVGISEDTEQENYKRCRGNDNEKNGKNCRAFLPGLAAAGDIVRRTGRLCGAGAGRRGVVGIGVSLRSGRIGAGRRAAILRRRGICVIVRRGRICIVACQSCRCGIDDRHCLRICRFRRYASDRRAAFGAEFRVVRELRTAICTECHGQIPPYFPHFLHYPIVFGK